MGIKDDIQLLLKNVEVSKISMKSGIPQETISEYMKGDLNDMRLEHVDKLHKFYLKCNLKPEDKIIDYVEEVAVKILQEDSDYIITEEVKEQVANDIYFTEEMEEVKLRMEDMIYEFSGENG